MSSPHEVTCRAVFITDAGEMLCIDEITDGKYKKRVLSRRRPALMGASPEDLPRHEIPNQGMQNITSDIFEVMYEYSNLKRATFLNYKHCCLVLEGAKNAGMSGLADFCRSYLWSHAYPDNVLVLMEEMQDKGEDLLYDSASKMVQIRTEELIKSQHFLDIGLYLAYDIVCLENLNISSEMFLLENMIRWAEYKIWTSDGGVIPFGWRMRLQLSVILPHIRFLAIDPKDYNKMPDWLFTSEEKKSLLNKIYGFKCDVPLDNIIFDPHLKARTFQMPDMVYVYATVEHLVDYKSGRILEYCNDNGMFIETTKDSFDVLFRAKWCVKTLSQIITGIKVATQVNKEAFMNHQFYDEFLSVFLYDAETDQCIYSQKFAKNINYAAFTLITFDKRINLFEYDFIAARNQQRTEVVAKFIFHKSGFYPIPSKTQLEVLEFLNVEDDKEDKSLKIPI